MWSARSSYEANSVRGSLPSGSHSEIHENYQSVVELEEEEEQEECFVTGEGEGATGTDRYLACIFSVE